MNNKAEELLDFLNSSPTAFHAAAELKKELQQAGFKELDPSQKWNLKTGEKYFLSRNESAVIAFITGEDFLNQGFRIISSHTDSPALKIKPDPIIKKNGHYLLNTEIYGGPILNTWYDRDLSLAGKIVLKDSNSFNLKEKLIDLKKTIAVIPNLAIHLNKNVNKCGKIDKKKGLRALITQKQDLDSSLKNDQALEISEADLEPAAADDLTLKKLIAEFTDYQENEILEAELYLYPAEKAKFLGAEQELSLIHI